MNSSPPTIIIKNLCLSYQHHHLFDNFNFKLPTKKWTSILGPSGVGKSTLLRFIANLYNNEVKTISGKVVASDNKSLNNRISYMAQEDLLFPWLSCLDNALIGYRLRGTKITDELKAKAMNLLNQVELTNVVNLPPQKLSGGMRQRVALVRTLLEDRPVILMDEPFSALDTITRFKLQELAANLLRNRTVLLVTHDPLEALRLSDFIYTISGSPAKLSKPIKPKGATPRNSTDKELFAELAKLLKLLTEKT